MSRRPATRKPTRKERVLAFARERGWAQRCEDSSPENPRKQAPNVGECEWLELRAALPDLPEKALRESGLAIAPPWCGVRQKTFLELRESLLALSEVYAARPDLRRYCRDVVIAARDHAKLASQNQRVDPAKRVVKAGMVEWMRVWLGDPAVFPVWSEILARNEEFPAN